jgi:hypothetical protein
MGCGCHRADVNCRLYLEVIVNDAICLAMGDTDEGWERIDKKLLPQILAYKYHNTIAGIAVEMYQHAQGPVRDLAATLTAKLRLDEIQDETFDELKRYTLKGIKDEHKYARFRATIATIEHRWYEQRYVNKMKETLIDIVETEPSLAKLANSYLKKIK